MNILCTICARGGSKGVKNKNIKNLNGKPLIAHTIEIAKKTGIFSKIVVSTDSNDIADVAEKYGAEVPFIRPKELATDSSGKIDAIKHAVDFLENEYNERIDIIIDLDVTSPLRRVEDIINSYNKLIKEKLDIVYSVCEARKNPYFNMVELNERGIPELCKVQQEQVLSRQKAPKVYELNASIYVYKRDFLMNTNTVYGKNSGIYVMPQELSIDIDNEIDFEFVEFMMNKISKEGKFI